MELQYVSEVDRKFLMENMLTNEDFGETDNYACFDDLLFDDETFTSNSQFLNDLKLSTDVDIDDVCRENSDSSDSGVHSLQFKEEPFSPANSDSSQDSFRNQDLSHFIFGNQFPVRQCSPYTTTSESSVPTLFLGSTNASEKKSVQSIINSQVKIQPKEPDSTSMSLTAALPSAQPVVHKSNQLVLTSDEFVKLANQGLLKFKPPNDMPGVATQTLQPQELKNMRKQQRMIKNRESASLSRKRKKEYLSSLEDQLSHYALENIQLKEENESLKQRITQLSTENNKLRQLKHPVTLTLAKKTTCLLAVLLFLGLNLASISDIFSMKSGDSYDKTAVRRGRHLMFVDNPKDEDKLTVKRPDYTQDTLMTRIRDIIETQTAVKNSSTPSLLDMCPTYFNSTQSLKLAERLAHWVVQHEQQFFKVPPTPPQRPHIAKKAVHSRRSKPSTQDQLPHRPKDYPVTVFSQSYDKSHDLYRAIDRRNDTFYVLSFNTDYFLLPATRLNNTRRPRMSLVVPALVPLNETLQPPAGSLGMMQIDCEVIDTRLIHVKKSSVPNNYRTKNNTKQQRHPENPNQRRQANSGSSGPR